MKATETVCQPFTDNFGAKIASDIKAALTTQAEISFEAGVKEGIRLANEVGLDHFIVSFMTRECHPTCKACNLLKEWGLKKEARNV